MAVLTSLPVNNFPVCNLCKILRGEDMLYINLLLGKCLSKTSRVLHSGKSIFSRLQEGAVTVSQRTEWRIILHTDYLYKESHKLISHHRQLMQFQICLSFSYIQIRPPPHRSAYMSSHSINHIDINIFLSPVKPSIVKCKFKTNDQR